ncbi:GNAT family N-acetyltransferase [Williamsia sterculiae]|nr:GNAT family N-acetyltransferase [Williamsia sterculiae]
MDLEMRSFAPSSAVLADEPASAEFLRAVELGFHGAGPGEETIRRWLADMLRNDARLRAMYDHDTGGFRDPDDPVGTFLSYDKTVGFGDGVLLPADAITDVTVRATHRRRGILRSLMTTDLAVAHDRGLPLAALTVSESGIYRRFGFGPAAVSHQVTLRTDRSFALDVPTSGRVEMTSRADYLAHADTVFDEFHRRTAGSVSRSQGLTDALAGVFDHHTGKPDEAVRHALHIDDTGVPTGSVTWKVDDDSSTATVRDFVAVTPEANLALWDFLGHLDLITTVVRRRTPVEDPLRYALREPDVYEVSARGDFLWLRVLDVARVLEARTYLVDGEVTLTVVDDQGFTGGTYRLAVSKGAATVERTRDADTDVTLDVAALGSAVLGGVPVAALAGAGRIHGAAVDELARLLVTLRAPVSLTPF